MPFRLACRRYLARFRAPIRTSHGVWTEREGVFVRYEDADGRATFGEAAPLPVFGTETVAEIMEAAPHLSERWLDSANAVPAELGCLRAAVRACMAELERRTRPGAETELLPAEKTEDYWPVAALLPAGRRALEQIDDKAEAGFRTFKWKVGVEDWMDELGLMDDLIGRLPTGGKLRLDANGAWDRRRAEKWLERCADRPVEFVEQPVAAEARGAEDLLCGLAADFPTVIALDESIATDRHVERWLGLGWRGIFVIKPMLLSDPQTVLAALKKANVPVVFSSALETAVGAASGLRLAFDFAGERRPLGYGVYPLFEDARFNGPSAAPFLRRSDLNRGSAEELWAELA